MFIWCYICLFIFVDGEFWRGPHVLSGLGVPKANELAIRKLDIDVADQEGQRF